MTRTRLSVVVYLLLVFSSGAAVGALGHWYFRREAPPPPRPSPEEFRRRFMEEMRTRLKLTDEQARQIETILDETRERWRAHMHALQEEQTSRINALLNDEQRAEYKKMRREHEERRKRGHKPPRR
jgi:Spy/CpxP family protein refolding chaperone